MSGWKPDGTGTEMIDGTESTCDAAFNRGYDAGVQATINPAVAALVSVDKLHSQSDDWFCAACGTQSPCETATVVGAAIAGLPYEIADDDTFLGIATEDGQS